MSSVPQNKWAEYPPVFEPEIVECWLCYEQIPETILETCTNCCEDGCEHCLIYDGPADEYFCSEECRKEFYEQKAKARVQKILAYINQYLHESGQNTSICFAKLEASEALRCIEQLSREADDENNQ